MARKKAPAPESREVAINEAAVAESMSAATALATLQREANERTHALAAQLKYEGSLAPDALENGVREALRRMSMGVFELGAYLLLLREASVHGEFASRLDRLGMEPRAAQRYMQVTRRFSNAKSNSHFAALGKSKMLEMLVLDDEQLEELALTGQTGELALDDVATMSVKELRAALRNSTAEHEAKDALIANKNAKIDKLERDKLRVQKLPPDAEQELINKEATSAMNDARAAVIGHLRQAFLAVQAGPGTGDKVPFMSGLIGQVQQDLNALFQEFRLLDLSNAADRVLLAEMSEWDKPAGQTDEAKAH